jgi:hypothetical protein
MQFGNPSVALLRNTFLRAVKQALGNCEEAHSGHYRSRCRSLANASWTEIGPNVQAIQVAETEFLIRGFWQYTIDLRSKGQLQIPAAFSPLPFSLQTRSRQWQTASRRSAATEGYTDTSEAFA